MKKNGFTLIELLAVIVIIVLLFIFLYPSVKSIISKSKVTITQTQINTILKAAYDYTLIHVDSLPTLANETKSVTLAELKKENLIDIDIVDPNTEEPYSNDLIIEITKSSSTNFDSSVSRKEGEYLYTINYNKLDVELNKYDSTININNSYANPSASDITSVKDGDTVISSYDTIILISREGSIVDSIDTSIYATYDINYTVKSGNKAGTKTIRVAILDNESPTISTNEQFQSTVNLNIGESFNINTGIACADNSLECKIIADGSININKEGTYILNLYAVDPSGNRSSNTITRVIKVG